MASATKRASRGTYRAIAWLLHCYIPLGALTVLDGNKGASKSTLMVDLAARVSRGRGMPLGLGSSLTQPARVLIYEAEDPEGRVEAMLSAAGADLKLIRVAYPGDEPSPLTLPDDMPRLARLARKAKPKLIVLSPVTTMVRGGLNNEISVRRALVPLNKLAAELQAAVVLLRHVDKTGKAGLGSVSTGNLARSVLRLARDPANDENRVLAVADANWAAKPKTSLLFRPIEDGDCTKVFWLGEIPLQAHDPIEAAGDKGALEDAKAFVRTFLANGRRTLDEFMEEARLADVASKTLRRARKALRVVASHEGFGGDAVHYVELPPDPYGAAIALELQRAEAEQQRLAFLEDLKTRKPRRVTPLSQAASLEEPHSINPQETGRKKRRLG